jgi:hypothetical protein
VEGGNKRLESGKNIRFYGIKWRGNDWTLARECNREKVKCCGEGNEAASFGCTINKWNKWLGNGKGVASNRRNVGKSIREAAGNAENQKDSTGFSHIFC